MMSIFRFKSLKIHDVRVHCGYKEGNVSAIALRSVNPSDLIATNVYSRRRRLGWQWWWCCRRFVTDSLIWDMLIWLRDARVIHFNYGRWIDSALSFPMKLSTTQMPYDFSKSRTTHFDICLIIPVSYGVANKSISFGPNLSELFWMYSKLIPLITQWRNTTKIL